ncbi:MAG: PAS domain-containing protein, partial [Actinomycetota bacterium]|nr:PAS domain-containing protein [Actinomycetota bacterium]
MSDHLLVVTPAAVLDAVSRAVVATLPDGSIIYWNRGAELLYGWSAEEVVGSNILEVLVPRAMAGEAAAILERVRVGGEWSGEFVTRHK